MASASCASVSKHAMYCCGEPQSCGQKHRICSDVKDSANHAQCVAVTIHPPMPIPWSSAIASAAAKHAKMPGRCRGLSLSCVKHCCIQRIAALLSLLRCTSERSGSAMRIHVPLCAAVTLGRSFLALYWRFACENYFGFDGQPKAWWLCDHSGAVVECVKKGLPALRVN